MLRNMISSQRTCCGSQRHKSLWNRSLYVLNGGGTPGQGRGKRCSRCSQSPASLRPFAAMARSSSSVIWYAVVNCKSDVIVPAFPSQC